MKEEQGDLWKDRGADAVCFTTNGVLSKTGRAVMGKGTALEAKRRFPGIDVWLGQQIRMVGNIPIVLDQRHWWLGKRASRLVSFPVKQHWRERADPELILQSARILVGYADRAGWKLVVLPRPGCGAGGLRWADVKPLLEPILDDRFLVVGP